MKLYLCDKSGMNIDDYFERVLDCLDFLTRESVLRFRQQEDRHRAMLRELLLREVLLETFPQKQVQIDKNEYGKPIIAGMQDMDGNPCVREEYAGFDFNISHSGDLVVIAFGANINLVGVDVERIERIKDYKKILRFFSKEEQDMINTSQNPVRDFYRVWTYREAFSKLAGIGLSLFEKEPVHINYEECHVIYHGEKYIFHEYDYPNYQITLCTGHNIKAPTPVIKGEELLLKHIS